VLIIIDKHQQVDLTYTHSRRSYRGEGQWGENL